MDAKYKTLTLHKKDQKGSFSVGCLFDVGVPVGDEILDILKLVKSRHRAIANLRRHR